MHHCPPGEDVQREGGDTEGAGGGDREDADLRQLGLPRVPHLGGAEAAGRDPQLHHPGPVQVGPENLAHKGNISPLQLYL